MSVVPSQNIRIIVGILSCNVMFAAPNPPPPIPPPPGTPIDGGTYMLLIISFFFGMYIINKKIKKASK